jgi:arylsulfatase A-like enzyme
MATLFTGVLPFVHGVRSLHGYKLDPEVATLAELLRDAGYETRAEATGPVREMKGFARGFREFRHRSPVADTLTTSDYWLELQRVFGTLPTDRPWFLYLHVWEMHWPRFLPAAFDRPRYGAHRYERALSALDVLRMHEIIDLAGPDTIIVVTGDHGEIPRFDRMIGLGRRFRLKPITRFFGRRAGHSFHVYEDLVRVPLVLAGPGVPSRGKVRTAIRHLDVFPTILDLAGVSDERASQAQGSTVRPLFEAPGPDRPGYSEAVSVNWTPDRWLVSVRDGGWKYVKRVDGSARWLWKLPDEKTDLTRRHPEQVDRLELLLSEMQGGASLAAHGEDLSQEESSEMEKHLRELGYLE